MSHGNYIISDTHFNHKNVIKYCNRPFESVEEMNRKLINNWNSTVKKTDTIYHLGDFAFGNKEYIIELLSKLNGKKILIMGNHCRRIKKNPSWWIDVGFDVVYQYPVIYNDNFILSHEPVDEIGRFINIHGHLHDKSIDGNYHNVCVENANYKPINLDKLISRLGKEV